jgi:hypothetical protein
MSGPHSKSWSATPSACAGRGPFCSATPSRRDRRGRDRALHRGEGRAGIENRHCRKN